jgi:hypothetical protein
LPHDVPPEVASKAEARAAARAKRDWAAADRFKSEVEAAGWRVVDDGLRYTLRPAGPPDVVVDGGVLYGSSVSVPSRLDAAPVGVATVVLVARDDPERLEHALSALREHGPDGTQLVVVGEAPSPEQAAALDELDALDPGGPGIGTEVVWTSARLGRAAAWNAGIRRAEAPIVVVLDAGLALPTADVVSPLVELLSDSSIAVAGPWGLRFAPGPPDFRRLERAAGDVVAIDGAMLAFRRSDYARRGPLDEAFRDGPWLDVWWSLMLRDPASTADATRRAVATAGLPVERVAEPEAAHPRLAKRNYYRLLERFRGREVEFG